jgi:hypothetical protein
MESFNKLLSFRRKSLSLHNVYNTTHIHYQYIEDFENASEEDCIKIDKHNNDVYKKNQELYKELTEKIKKENALFKLDNPPASPIQPNNYDRLIQHRSRNVSKNVRLQTFALAYLADKGYQLVFEKDITENTHVYEPHQAIDIVEKMENEKIELVFKKFLNNKKSNPINIPHNYYKSELPIYPSAPPMSPPWSHMSVSAPAMFKPLDKV